MGQQYGRSASGALVSRRQSTLTEKRTKIVQITTHRNSSSNLADIVIVMRPNADLAILNFLQREIVKRGVMNRELSKSTAFLTGVTDIGYGLRNTDKYARPAEKDTLAKQLVVKLDKYEASAKPQAWRKHCAKKFRRLSRQSLAHILRRLCQSARAYTLDFVAELAKGDNDESLDTFKQKLMTLADLVCDKERKMMSFGAWASISISAAFG